MYNMRMPRFSLCPRNSSSITTASANGRKRSLPATAYISRKAAATRATLAATSTRAHPPPLALLQMRSTSQQRLQQQLRQLRQHLGKWFLRWRFLRTSLWRRLGPLMRPQEQPLRCRNLRRGGQRAKRTRYRHHHHRRRRRCRLSRTLPPLLRLLGGLCLLQLGRQAAMAAKCHQRRPHRTRLASLGVWATTPFSAPTAAGFRMRHQLREEQASRTGAATISNLLLLLRRRPHRACRLSHPWVGHPRPTGRVSQK